MYVFMRVSIRVFIVFMSASIVFVCLFIVVPVYTLHTSLGGHLGEDSFILSVGCTD